VRHEVVYGRWTRSSTPSVRTTRRCATPRETIRNLRTPLATTDRSSRYLHPHREESLPSRANRSNRAGAVAEPSHALIGRSTSSSEATRPKRTRGNRSSPIGRSWWQPTVPRPCIGGRNTPSRSAERTSGSTLITLASI
jgi:hypothetical protein